MTTQRFRGKRRWEVLREPTVERELKDLLERLLKEAAEVPLSRASEIGQQRPRCPPLGGGSFTLAPYPPLPESCKVQGAPVRRFGPRLPWTGVVPFFFLHPWSCSVIRGYSPFRPFFIRGPALSSVGSPLPSFIRGSPLLLFSFARILSRESENGRANKKGREWGWTHP